MTTGKLHAVMVPLPTPGHINPMLKLAKILHSRGFHITFVVTDYTRHCLIRAGGADPLQHAVEGFRFEAVSDGLPMSGRKGLKELEELGVALRTKFPVHFRDLLRRLHGQKNNNGCSSPPVTCVIAGFMSSALRVADEMGILKILFWTSSACGFMSTLKIDELINRGYIPLKDESCLTNGYLETQVDWIPGMKGVRLRDLVRFIRTTKHNDLSLHLEKEEAEIAHESWGVILNTFDALEGPVVSALRRTFQRVYTLGSMSALADQLVSPSIPLKATATPQISELNIWKSDSGCLRWLDTQRDSSVVYVNFGSLTVLTAEQLMEFAWGLARSGHPFLWIIRPDLVVGGGASAAAMMAEFVQETRGRCCLASWCPQADVLAHPAVGGFLTHAGWNSVLESIRGGVPMLCWPFFAEQPTNCRYICKDWGIGLEIEGEVSRGQVSGLVREIMDGGDKAKALRFKAGDWKRRADSAVAIDGSSYLNLDRLVNDLRMQQNKLSST